jgi:hypothetical protein
MQSSAWGLTRKLTVQETVVVLLFDSECFLIMYHSSTVWEAGEEETHIVKAL